MSTRVRLGVYVESYLTYISTGIFTITLQGRSQTIGLGGAIEKFLF